MGNVFLKITLLCDHEIPAAEAGDPDPGPDMGEIGPVHPLGQKETRQGKEAWQKEAWQEACGQETDSQEAAVIPALSEHIKMKRAGSIYRPFRFRFGPLPKER